MILTDWESFSRIFSNRFDTYWWLGKEYYTKHGQQWPYEGQEPPEGYVYPSSEGFKTALILALLITVLRFAVERLIAEPIGRWFGLQHKLPGTPAGPNRKLEMFISKYKKPTSLQIEAVAAEADMEVRQVEIWVRRRQRELCPSKLNKFKEAFWRFCFYTSVFCYGLYTITQEDFFYNTMLCWVGFPTHTWAIKKSIYIYYLLEGSFYLSLIVSQFMDTKRKDFWEMFLHHIVTLILIGGSYWGGGYRVGTLVMATHDISDVFLESAKMSVYTHKKTASNLLFGGFTISFFSSRLVFFPFKILNCAIAEGGYVVQQWPAHIVYCAFLVILQILHIWWFTFIIKVLVKVVSGDPDLKDNRSDDDETPPSSNEEDSKED